jgi:hypothetical protein
MKRHRKSKKETAERSAKGRAMSTDKLKAVAEIDFTCKGWGTVVLTRNGKEVRPDDLSESEKLAALEMFIGYISAETETRNLNAVYGGSSC